MANAVSERGRIIWGTCKGRLGEPGKNGSGGTKGGHNMELHNNNNSKNPYEQSSVREESVLGNFRNDAWQRKDSDAAIESFWRCKCMEICPFLWSVGVSGGPEGVLGAYPARPHGPRGVPGASPEVPGHCGDSPRIPVLLFIRMMP